MAIAIQQVQSLRRKAAAAAPNNGTAVGNTSRPTSVNSPWRMSGAMIECGPNRERP